MWSFVDEWREWSVQSVWRVCRALGFYDPTLETLQSLRTSNLRQLVHKLHTRLKIIYNRDFGATLLTKLRKVLKIFKETMIFQVNIALPLSCIHGVIQAWDGTFYPFLEDSRWQLPTSEHQGWQWIWLILWMIIDWFLGLKNFKSTYN